MSTPRVYELYKLLLTLSQTPNQKDQRLVLFFFISAAIHPPLELSARYFFSNRYLRVLRSLNLSHFHPSLGFISSTFVIGVAVLKVNSTLTLEGRGIIEIVIIINCNTINY